MAPNWDELHQWALQHGATCPSPDDERKDPKAPPEHPDVAAAREIHDVAVSRGARCITKAAKASGLDYIRKAASGDGKGDQVMTVAEAEEARKAVFREVQSRPIRSANGEIGYRSRVATPEQLEQLAKRFSR